jgi:predicted  nucleic acid-binding Zn-ribbon protein
MSDKKVTSVGLDPKNAEYLDQETNNKSRFINDLIEAHRHGTSEMEEVVIRYQREQLQSELRQIESRKESVESQLEIIDKRVTSKEQHREEQFAEAREVLADVPADPENPAVENWASKLDMTPSELLEELADG